MTQELTREQQRLLDALVRDAAEALRGGRSEADVRADLLGRGLTDTLAAHVLAQVGADATAARPAVDLSRQVWVVRLPPEADPSELVGAPDMGTRDEVAERIRQALPGTSFDADGRGRFEKAGFSLEFELGSERMVNLVSLEIRGGGAALSAIRALALRTGWRVLDRSEDKLFDIPGLRPAEPAPPEPARIRRPEPRRGGTPPGAGDAAAKTVRIPPRRAGGRGWIGVAVGVALAAALAGAWALRGSADAEANEARALADVAQFAAAEREFGVANLGGHVAPDVLADPSRYAALLASGSPLGGLADARFATPERDGYRFEFRGEPGTEVGGALVKPAWESFSYVAVPLRPGQTGRRSFAYFSDERAVFARDDGSAPTPDDQAIQRFR